MTFENPGFSAHETDGVVTELTPEELAKERADMAEMNITPFSDENPENAAYLSSLAMVNERLETIEAKLLDADAGEKVALEMEKKALEQRRAELQAEAN